MYISQLEMQYLWLNLSVDFQVSFNFKFNPWSIIYSIIKVNEYVDVDKWSYSWYFFNQLVAIRRVYACVI